MPSLFLTSKDEDSGHHVTVQQESIPLLETVAQTGFWGTWFTILCTMAGTGILGLPYTLRQGGWLCIVLILITGAATNYTGKALISCLHHGPDGKKLTGYPDVGEAAFGRMGRLVVHVFHKATLLGVTTLFLILTAKFLLEGIGGGGEGFFDLGSEADATKWQHIWLVVSAILVLFPLVVFRTLGEATPMTFFGMFTSVLIVAVVLIVTIVVTTPGADYDLPVNTSSIAHKWVDVSELPTAFSAITLSFGGHAVFPTIESHMSNKPDFPKVLNSAYVLLLVLYLTCAISGYAAFGDGVDSPVLCDMPRTGALGAVAKATKLVVAAHVLMAYPVLMNVVVREVEERVGCAHADGLVPFLKRTGVRTTFVSATAVVALFLPYFAEMMSFVGAACLTMIVFIMPVACSFKLRRHEMGGVEQVLSVCVALMGIVGGAIGCVQSVHSIADKLAHHASQ